VGEYRFVLHQQQPCDCAVNSRRHDLVCLIQPLNGVVFILDGLLIGAHDTCYLMKAMLAGAAIMIPLAWSSLQWGWGLMKILVSITALMLWRGTTNVSRFAGNGWTNLPSTER